MVAPAGAQVIVVQAGKAEQPGPLCDTEVKCCGTPVNRGYGSISCWFVFLVIVEVLYIIIFLLVAFVFAAVSSATGGALRRMQNFDFSKFESEMNNLSRLSSSSSLRGSSISSISLSGGAAFNAAWASVKGYAYCTLIGYIIGLILLCMSMSKLRYWKVCPDSKEARQLTVQAFNLYIGNSVITFALPMIGAILVIRYYFIGQVFMSAFIPGLVQIGTGCYWRWTAVQYANEKQ